MTKKSIKYTMIVLVAIVIVATATGVLYWGLQPVQKDSVSLEKLNKRLGARYSMPSELPFEGDIECNIIYVEAHMGVVLTRFEASSKRSTGYSIDLKDSNREICIETGDAIIISAELAEKVLIENYNGQKIKYLLIESDTDSKLVILFEINGKTYYISASYIKDVDSKILKSDMEFILNQMVK